MNECFFAGVDGICAAKTTYCNRDYNNCSFYKTEKQYTADRNRAILINRKKGNCENCKYVAVKCELTKVKEGDI